MLATMRRIIVLVLLLSASNAAAQGGPPTVKLDYEVDAGCPVTASFRDIVVGRMGYDPFRPQAHRTARVRLTRGPSGFIGVLQIVEADGRVSGQRQLADSDCVEVARALATAASVAIDPLSSGQDSSHEAPSTRESAAVPQDPRAAPETTAPSPTPQTATPIEQGTRVWLGGGLSGGLGVAPAPVVGVRFGASMNVGRLSAGLVFRYDAPVGDPRADSGDLLSIDLLGLELCGCLDIVGPLSVCVVGWGGSYQTVAPRLERPKTVSSFFAHLGGRARLVWPVSSWGRIWVQADVLGAMTRVAHVIGDETVWTAAPVAGFLSAGVSVRAL